MPEHTPGPWAHEDVGEYVQIFAPADGNLILAWVGDEPDDTDRANAALMAAAPDLLDALESAMQFLENIEGRTLRNGIILSYMRDLPQMRAALAKARPDPA